MNCNSKRNVLPEPDRSGSFFSRKEETIRTLLQAEKREMPGIEKMILFGKCADIREKKLVADFLALWERKEDGI